MAAVSEGLAAQSGACRDGELPCPPLEALYLEDAPGFLKGPPTCSLNFAGTK